MCVALESLGTRTEKQRAKVRRDGPHEENSTVNEENDAMFGLLGCGGMTCRRASICFGGLTSMSRFVLQASAP